MMVVVHSVCWVTAVRKLNSPILDRMDNNVLKLHIYTQRKRWSSETLSHE
jgi:hypothetical protein